MRKEFSLADTIASIASFPSKAAVGVIKISGKKSLEIISKIFKPKKRKDIRKVQTYTLHYGWIVDKSKERREKIVDEVLVGVMKAPFSYTREDVVEIYSHSGQVVLNKILDLVLKRGARQALPGEFTRRAFLRGRIDLSQAEAVLDIVEAKTEKALELGLFQLEGRLSERINQIEEILKRICSELEAELSFPEDVQIKKDYSLDIQRAIKKIKDLLKNSEKGRLLKEGAFLVICGKANVGKSSLLNMLLREERVIVTPFAGTTRDVIEEDINIRGLPLKIYDTAGILEPKDLIEKKALEKSYKKIEEADLILLVFDGSQKLTSEDFFLIDKTREKKVIFVINKTDLPLRIGEEMLKRYKKPLVKISALFSKGLKNLETKILKVIFKEGLDKEGEIFLSNKRHIALLKEALNLLEKVKADLRRGFPLDFLFFNLREALERVSEITGKNISGDILDSIFSKFCIGK
ncbi:MAG TPA: tRNA uridine-5-carboxymethylaminomethyl(34) synthesis GTPase MnmE [Candidatus Omnitrophica bacterium]|nr:MAG: tRNA uridine-5-carboxymethylaminomethyl(34) synthesis GTPase MnmE [Candidatus Omnitrophota bacterium]RKY34916.1 MAG: tRNA uridine-5-carboxymethylaminomethyl(34) synthesis GTPase MnmE [Candidatus Omnitrophota bacterium]RKY44797.1 MAG: tRNA uridine-5-carboxymethylaminomethyl(34) synthesis GTPase MnmE [Candidatus Omnitrophota bacterium]HEC68670.1 tRNA uridine-5-carboxymethylaminomethyl(34) synthesis GTPase MnmE [Candidatus Omnitrophota bacterium]